ncbi:MAG TPA: hypothetical protein VI612_02650 [Candidatus Nanoarchaeia archaeon]|nr:hypothetical protein [Candidatus Nanoarchaeia archaeon]
MAVEKTLEEVLKENDLTEANLSPLVSREYTPSSKVNYVPPGPRNQKTPEQRVNEASPFEKEILAYLKERGINHEFERPLVVKEGEEIHVRLPDFYLPDRNLFIELNGMEGDPEQDKRYEEKNRNYDKNGIKYVVIHKDEMKSGKWKEKLEGILGKSEPKASPSGSSVPVYAGIATCLLTLLYLL